MNSKLYCCLVVLAWTWACQLLLYVESANILAFYPFPSKSHNIMHRTMITELLQRGHRVTTIVAMSLGIQKELDNYTEIIIEPAYDVWKDIIERYHVSSALDLTKFSALDFVEMNEYIGLQSAESALKDFNVQRLINATNTKGVYDLLLSEQFYQEALLAFAYKYQMPIVTANTLGYMPYMAQMRGLIMPPTFVPHLYLSLTDRMSFMERLENTYVTLATDYYRQTRYFPQMDKLVQKYFAHLPIELPKVADMEKNVSIVLLNNHVPIAFPQPTTDTLVYVGGLHLKEPNELPIDLKMFLDEAKHGAIYFCLGSNVPSKDMPLEILDIFLKTFASLKQHVLWKFENDSISNLPKNVMIKKWMPQSDILAHPNVKVFITHGGLFGTQETVYNGVPVLGIPFYSDQHQNIKNAVTNGWGKKLHFQSITKDELKHTLEELINNPSYKLNAKKASHIFRDRQMKPLDTAIYWIEYVLRHNGARHLKCAGVELKWYQFYMLDIALCFILITIAIVVIIVCIKQNLTQELNKTKPMKSKKRD